MPAKLRMLEQHLRSQGFSPGAPSAEVAAQDEGVCERSACNRCGAVELAYHPYVHRTSKRFAARYRAFAMCLACGHIREF